MVFLYHTLRLETDVDKVLTGRLCTRKELFLCEVTKPCMMYVGTRWEGCSLMTTATKVDSNSSLLVLFYAIKNSLYLVALWP